MTATRIVVPTIVLLLAMAGCTRHHVTSATEPEIAGTEIAVLDDRPVRSGQHLWWVTGDSVYRGEAGPRPLHARRMYHRPGATLGPIAVVGPDQAVVVDGHRIVGVPAPPGAAAGRVVVLARPLRGGLRTDGRSLFWADELGIHSAPVTGGAVRTLMAQAWVLDVDVRAGRVFFAVGRTVKSVPAGGGPVRTDVMANNNVTSICAGTGLYWVELGVEVHSRAGLLWLAPPGPAGPRERARDDASGLGWDGHGPYRLVRDGDRCDIESSR